MYKFLILTKIYSPEPLQEVSLDNKWHYTLAKLKKKKKSCGIQKFTAMKSPEEFSKTFALNLQNLNLCEWTQKSIFIKYSPGDVDMAAPQFNTWGSGF